MKKKSQALQNKYRKIHKILGGMKRSWRRGWRGCGLEEGSPAGSFLIHLRMEFVEAVLKQNIIMLC